MRFTDSLSQWINPLHTTSPEALPEGHMVPLSLQILTAGVQAQFSDIHFRPHKDCMAVLARRFGQLMPWFTFPKSHWARLSARFKVMAAVNITESRRPQSGRIHIEEGGQKVDIRFSSHPTLQGESVVLRVLDPRVGFKDINMLGLAPDMCFVLQSFLEEPQGMMVVTGPTGSGKTTLLYALLQQLIPRQLNIMTLEQPIEYQVEGLRQTEVQEDLDLDFAKGLRSILRHDPDVILVGETRDAETAQIALRAAMTGHKVLTTLHTATCNEIVPRMLDLGVPQYMVKDALQCGIAVRLIPELCEHCRETIPISKDIENAFHHVNMDVPDVHYKARGCNACAETGYVGRRLVGEVQPFHGDGVKTGEPGLSASMRKQALSLLAAGLTDWTGVSRNLGGGR